MKIIVLEIDLILNNYYSALNTYLIDKHGLCVLSNKCPTFSYLYPTIFEDFVKNKGLIDLTPKYKVIELINHLKNEGFIIYLVTQRDDEVKDVVHQTFNWLRDHRVEYTDLFFAPNKERWYSYQNFFRLDDIVFAIEYNPRWIEYLCSTEIKVISPYTQYLPSINSNWLKVYYDTQPNSSLESVVKSIIDI